MAVSVNYREHDFPTITRNFKPLVENTSRAEINLSNKTLISASFFHSLWSVLHIDMSHSDVRIIKIINSWEH